MSNLKFDMTINLGTIINVVLIMVAIAAGFTSFQARMEETIKAVNINTEARQEHGKILERLTVIAEQHESRLDRLEGQ